MLLLRQMCVFIIAPEPIYSPFLRHGSLFNPFSKVHTFRSTMAIFLPHRPEVSAETASFRIKSQVCEAIEQTPLEKNCVASLLCWKNFTCSTYKV